MSTTYDVDGIQITTSVQQHEGRLYVKTEQPVEDAILERNKELQKDEGALRDLSFGRMVADIPRFAFLYIIPRDYPDFLRARGHEQAKILMKMLRDHPEWRVQSKAKTFARTH